MFPRTHVCVLTPEPPGGGQAHTSLSAPRGGQAHTSSPASGGGPSLYFLSISWSATLMPPIKLQERGKPTTCLPLQQRGWPTPPLQPPDVMLTLRSLLRRGIVGASAAAPGRPGPRLPIHLEWSNPRFPYTHMHTLVHSHIHEPPGWPTLRDQRLIWHSQLA